MISENRISAATISRCELGAAAFGGHTELPSHGLAGMLQSRLAEAISRPPAVGLFKRYFTPRVQLCRFGRLRSAETNAGNSGKRQAMSGQVARCVGGGRCGWPAVANP
jgi:hypothetical protein